MNVNDVVCLKKDLKVLFHEEYGFTLAAGTVGVLNKLIDSNLSLVSFDGSIVCVDNDRLKVVLDESEPCKTITKNTSTTAIFWRRKNDGLYLKVDSSRGHTKLNDSYSHVEDVFNASHLGYISRTTGVNRKEYDAVEYDIESTSIYTLKEEIK